GEGPLVSLMEANQQPQQRLSIFRCRVARISPTDRPGGPTQGGNGNPARAAWGLQLWSLGFT
ncbi:MAG: hypothetical protein ACE5JX_20905, partial [Acidobacteriota bacterium]